MSNSFVINFNLSLAEKLENTLKVRNFLIEKTKNTVFLAKSKNVSCTLYSSGKLVIQGKEAKTFIEFVLEPEILENFEFSTEKLEDYESRMGIDESGKGDFFGPLCIAGVGATKEDILKLSSLKVKDSKSLTDDRILSLAKSIKLFCKYNVVKINPPKYNELYSKFNNLNKLLAWGHATVIENLSKKYPQFTKAVSDQFASENVLLSALKNKNIDITLVQMTKAERDPVVAAASILAREAFITGLKELEKRYNLFIPKGSSNIINIGKEIVKKSGISVLDAICKKHFKSYNEILK